MCVCVCVCDSIIIALSLIHAYTHTHARARTHTHTHTQTYILLSSYIHSKLLLNLETADAEFLFDLPADDNSERQHFLPPVQLDPGWEGIDRPPDELNFRTLERVEELERNQPRDRLNIVYIIMVIHGIGILMPWNMFINAKAVSSFGYRQQSV